jgi:hypothetical protein
MRGSAVAQRGCEKAFGGLSALPRLLHKQESLLSGIFVARAGCDKQNIEMSIWSAISRLMTVLAVAGLVAGAWIAPAKAWPMVDIGPVVSDGMPCCDPPQESPDCQDMTLCPFAAVCAVQSSQSTPPTGFDLPPLPTKAAPVPDFDRKGDSLSSSPLGHPPKA